MFYGDHGRRILCTDPFGTILHECEWSTNMDGTVSLSRARVRLDSLLWVGLIPRAANQATTFDLSPLQDRSSIRTEDLRRRAARAWHVPLEDMRYFFPDSSFEWGLGQRVSIRLTKDGLYLLEDGSFAHSQFMSYMGAIPWARIDLLNVVELFQSTLPGTGSAVLELIWGLCDDQSRTDGPISLHYRGLPTYPSEPAYGLFSSFFRSDGPNGQNPHELFMDTQRAYQIAWWPRHDPPWRYFDRARRLTVTVQSGVIQKITVTDDSVGVPYVAPETHGGFASCGRLVLTEPDRLVLCDGRGTQAVRIDSAWGVTVTAHTSAKPSRLYSYDWRAFFPETPPGVDLALVHALALLYPDDDTEVAELSTQPFVLEQCYASLNRLENLRARLAGLQRVLIDGFDAVATGCIDLDYARHHTVLYRSAEWAQKQAQVLWDQAAKAGRLDAVRHTRFLPANRHWKEVSGTAYDLIYCWIPFEEYGNSLGCERIVAHIMESLNHQGLAFVIGPQGLLSTLIAGSISVREYHGVEELSRLPLLTEHFRLHPRTRLNSALNVFMVEKTRET
ncbi:MAG: hypothetical protein HZB35_06865 [Nitrospirae bacterium]|nr:hypothetical protein [Nitrospirota bacterium]